MIPRYTLPEMGALWSEQNKFQKWLDVELAVCEVHAEMGTIPREAVGEIKSKAAFTVERINEIEKTTDHDVIAFTTALAESIGEAARFVHFGLTFALWYDETRRNRERLSRAREAVAVGKISGAVGAFAHLDPEVEEKVCERLGLPAAPLSTQIIQRDVYAEYLTTAAIVASSLEKFA